MKGVIEKIANRRADRILDMFCEFIERGSRVLDIGAGGGWIAEELKKRKGVDVILLDILDFNQSSLPHVIYDGKRIPFGDNSFDASLLIFTLHHCQNPAEILKEARRVTKGKIVIIEDIADSFFGRFFLYLWDFISNIPSIIKPPGESMFFNFKTVPEWKKEFNKCNLELVCEKHFKMNIFLNNSLFVVKK